MAESVGEQAGFDPSSDPGGECSGRVMARASQPTQYTYTTGTGKGLAPASHFLPSSPLWRLVALSRSITTERTLPNCVKNFFSARSSVVGSGGGGGGGVVGVPAVPCRACQSIRDVHTQTSTSTPIDPPPPIPTHPQHLPP